MTPAWLAALRAGDIGSLDAQVAAGADVDQRDRYGQTGLMICAREGLDAALDRLIEQGADLDHTAKHGLSALMLAVVNGRRHAVERLVAAGADRSMRGSGAPGFHARTALDLARERGDAGIVAALEQDPRTP